MTLILYQLSITIYGLLVRVAALFSAKAQLFSEGRKGIFPKMEKALKQEFRPVIWMHCASLGEFEQGRTLIEKIKSEQKNYCVVLTFFSPSGYEIRKEYPFADYVFYLPLDSKRNARRFIEIIKPQCALFVKYELWYFYLKELSVRSIPVVLFSAYFQRNQIFFKSYGGFYRKMLRFFNQIFVQDEQSKLLLQEQNIEHVSVAGDSRFDRCAKVVRNPKDFPFLNSFKGNKPLLIAGSTWAKDEDFIFEALKHWSLAYKILLVPHEIKKERIDEIFNKCPESVCLWREDEALLTTSKVAVVNEIGHLAYLYRYADAVWIGGGFTKSGVHNIIEAAVYGLPLFFGPNYHRFREAKELIQAGAAFSLTKPAELGVHLKNESLLSKQGQKAQNYVLRQLGATDQVYHYLSEKCFDKAV